MFANHLYAFHATLTPENETHLSSEEFLKEWTPADVRQMVYDESDTDMLVAMPLPLTDLFRDGLSPWETCAELASRDPDRTVLWGSVNPAGGPQGDRPHGASGRRVRRQGVQVLQRPLRLRLAVPVADGRPEGRVPDLREGAGTGRQPHRRAQGRAAGPAADRAHPDLGHGRRRRQLPRHQLRDLPRRAAVPRRDLLAADPLSEPLRLARRDDQLRRPGAADVRRDPRQAAVLVRRGQDRLRLRGADLPPAVGAAGVQGLLDPAGPLRRLRLPAAHRRRQAEDPRARTCCACTAWTSRRRRRGWAGRSRTDASQPGQCAGSVRAAGRRVDRVAPRRARPGAGSGTGSGSGRRPGRRRRADPRRAGPPCPRSTPRRSAPIR